MANALITGAAKGIGKALAFELANRGFNLLLIDIAKEELEAVAGKLQAEYPIKVSLFIQDLSHPEAAERIKTWHEANFSDLKILVNNAGFGLNGQFRHISLQEQLDMVNVNIKAQVSLTYLFIPVLERESPGYILNVGSTTAYQTVPYMTMYSASKHFVVAFNRGLKYELRDSTNISLTCLSPGATDTDFVNRAGMGESIRKTADKFNMTAESVAKIATDALFKGKAEVIPGWYNKLGAFLPRFFPEWFVAWVVGRIYQPEDEQLANSSNGKISRNIAKYRSLLGHW